MRDEKGERRGQNGEGVKRSELATHLGVSIQQFHSGVVRGEHVTVSVLWGIAREAGEGRKTPLNALLPLLPWRNTDTEPTWLGQEGLKVGHS